MRIGDIPEVIKDKITAGEAVLFLGAGASHGCVSQEDESKCPMGDELGRMLSDKFLGGKRKTESLSRVADYCQSESSVSEVQSWLYEVFDPIEPRDFHFLIPHFRWKAIVTTNYDRVVEKAYEKSKKSRLQELSVVTKNGDLARVIRDPSLLPLIKLHGCVSQYSDIENPLVIANEQYAKYSASRDRIASYVQELARACPLVFCGYKFNDLHLSQILVFNLGDQGVSRPRYLAVNPSFDDFDKRFLEQSRVTAVASTFEEFLRCIHGAIPETTRRLGQLLEVAHGPLSKHLQVGRKPSRSLQALLHGRLEQVHSDMPTEASNAERFYMGDSRSWAPIANDLDFRRTVTTKMYASLSVHSKGLGAQFILLTGYAGSGKTVVMRRIAWDLARRDGGALVFFSVGSVGGLADHLAELAEITEQRIYIFFDNLLDSPDEILKAIRFAKVRNLPFTFVAAARINEWNIAKFEFEALPDAEFSVGGLGPREASELCGLLEKHGQLGDLLPLSNEERVDRIMKTNERNLLVCLHEVTNGGRPLRNIILDEYRRLLPAQAQVLYLDICTLHRLGVLVRAGIISRISGITFDDFNGQFFDPLEKVISVAYDNSSRDYCYKARHRDIAQIVYEEALATPEARSNQIVRIVGHLNCEFSSDDRAASSMLKGKLLADEFADRNLADKIYESAMQAGLERTFVLQQRAIFELTHPGGRLRNALDFIDEAIRISARSNSSLHHTKALVLRALSRADGISSEMRNRYISDSLALLRRHGGLKNSYSAVTICEILLEQLRTRLEELGRDAGKLTDQVAVDKLTEFDRNLTDAIQRHPDSALLTNIRASSLELLGQTPRALALLQATFRRNPGNELIALRYAGQLRASEQFSEAAGVLRKALGLLPSSKPLNYALARLLIRRGDSADLPEIGVLLRRSFTEGDSNFDAQLWSARHEYLYGDKSRSRRIFSSFATKVGPGSDRVAERTVVRDPAGNWERFHGSVVHMKGDYAFVNCPNFGADIFLHRNEFEGDWQVVEIGLHLSFVLGFSYRGPTCLKAVPD